MLAATLILSLITAPLTNACASTGGGGGGTTPPSDVACPDGPSNTAGLTTYQVTAQNAGDTTTAVSHTSSCTSGVRNYWTSATSSSPTDIEASGQKALGVQCPTPSTFCVCNCAGVCCTPGTTAADTVSFEPFCSGGSKYNVI